MRPNCSVEVSIGDDPGRVRETRAASIRMWPRLRWPKFRASVTVIAPPGTSFRSVSVGNRREDCQ
jgi:hypothetical protein